MKKLVILAAAASLGAVLGGDAPATAQPLGWYGGAGYTSFEDGADLGGVTGRLGYQFTPYWGAEGEASFGVKDDGDTKLDNAVGVFGTGTLPVTQRLDAFGRVGYERINYGGDNPVDDSSDGIAFGGGLKYQLTDRFGVRGEYTRVGGDTDVNSWALSGVVNF